MERNDQLPLRQVEAEHDRRSIEARLSTLRFGAVAESFTEVFEDARLNYPAYASTILRAPAQPPVILPERLSDVTEPVYASALGRAAGTTHHRGGTAPRR
jgi:hypothetical protein